MPQQENEKQNMAKNTGNPGKTEKESIPGTTTPTEVEEIVEEFLSLTDLDNTPNSYDDVKAWLHANPDKHLFSFNVYGEPICDIDSERVAEWLRQKLLALYNAGEEAKKEAYERGREDAKDQIYAKLDELDGRWYSLEDKNQDWINGYEKARKNALNSIIAPNPLSDNVRT